MTTGRGRRDRGASSTTITAVEQTRTGYQVSADGSGASETTEFDLVVHGAGRIAELSGLDLDVAGGA